MTLASFVMPLDNNIILRKVRRFYLTRKKKRSLKQAQDYISRNQGLREVIEFIDKASRSTGVSEQDYMALYRIVRKENPKFVLECGTGKSTMVIAQAMLDNLDGNPIQGMKLISMEHDRQWYEHAVPLLPDKFRDFVEIHHSPMDVYGYSFVRGTVYKEVPDYSYLLVFVDGPHQGFEQTDVMCNMDFVRLVEKSDTPVSAVIDNRKHTVLAYSLIFGPEKVRNYPIWNLSVVDKVAARDMILADKNLMKRKIFTGDLVRKDYGNPF